MIKSKPTLVSMNLSNKTMLNIDLLSELIGESNRSRVVASAFEIANIILTQTNNGKQIILRLEDGSEQNIDFIIV